MIDEQKIPEILEGKIIEIILHPKPETPINIELLANNPVFSKFFEVVGGGAGRNEACSHSADPYVNIKSSSENYPGHVLYEMSNVGVDMGMVLRLRESAVSVFSQNSIPQNFKWDYGKFEVVVRGFENRRNPEKELHKIAKKIGEAVYGFANCYTIDSADRPYNQAFVIKFEKGTIEKVINGL